MQQPGEPSVEEILDSIKKVIARDNRDEVIATRRKRMALDPPFERVEPADEDEAEEVLELGHHEAIGGEDFPAPGDDGPPAYAPLVAAPGAARPAPLPAYGTDDFGGTGAGDEELDAAPADNPVWGMGDDGDAMLGRGPANDAIEENFAAFARFTRDAEPAPTDAAGAEAPQPAAASASPAPGTPGPGASPLEAMVREMLRPMLAQWLDTHLPPLVEELVRGEIARIASKHE